MKKHINKEIFIASASLTHKEKFNYSKVDYINLTTKVCIICPEHGEFWQRPADHLKGCGCAKCAGRASDTDFFIKKAKLKHGNRYSYSKVKYFNSKTKVCLICSIHGEFWQRPSEHLNGCGCQKCAGMAKTNDEFIRQSLITHGNRYDYSLIEYVDYKTKVCIICPEHGEFWQNPNNHIGGCGCPACNINKNSKLSLYIEQLLNENNVEYIKEKTFDWLMNKSHLFLDFYLPKYNLVIEVHGEQHFKPIKRFGGDAYLKIQKERDAIKLKLCGEHNIKIIYVTRKLNTISNILDIINYETTSKENNPISK